MCGGRSRQWVSVVLVAAGSFGVVGEVMVGSFWLLESTTREVAFHGVPF